MKLNKVELDLVPAVLSLWLAVGLTPAVAVAADPIPDGWTSKNYEPIGYTALDGHGGAHKITMKRDDGRWYVILGHFWTPGYSVIDVTDPENPRYAKFIPAKANTRTTQVTLSGDILIAGVRNETTFDHDPSLPPGESGTVIYDVSDPENWKRLSFYEFPGGNHRNWYDGGKYAYISAMGVEGLEGRILVIMDVSDPRNPKEVGRWWQPGQKEGESNPESRPLGFHGPAMASPDGRYLGTGYAPGVVKLDISNPAKPRLVDQVVMSPPMSPGSDGSTAVHSVLPIWDRGIWVGASEQTDEDCSVQGAHWVGLFDFQGADEKMRLISLLPQPVPEPSSGYETFCDKPGRFGPHNIPMETQNNMAKAQGDLLHVTWFNAGLRTYDISNPFAPKEIGWFIPATPTERTGPLPREALETQTQDVLEDTRGNIYITDYNLGMFVVRFTGEREN